MYRGWGRIAHNQYDKTLIDGTDTKDAKLNTNVIVRFGEDIPLQAQGQVLLHLEMELRKITGLDCRVFKDKMGDDSKLRIKMTPLERSKL